MPKKQFKNTCVNNSATEPQRVTFLDIPIDCITMSETVARVDRAMTDGKLLQHVAINVAKFVNLQNDSELREDVITADIIGIDGAGIVIGARLFGISVPERVTGIDLMSEILELCNKKGYKPYFFGAKQEVLEKAVENIKAKWGNIKIAGYRNGYFTPADEAQIVADIKNSGADCLFVAISTPIKERFCRKYKHKLGVSYLMGVGGSIDIMAGITKRAPVWMQKYGLEWLYRIIQEPKRMWKRYAKTNILYAWLLIKGIYKNIKRT